MKKTLFNQFQHRKQRTRAKLKGVSTKPLLNVTRSNKHIYVQIINPGDGRVLAALTDKVLEVKGKKTEKAFALGKEIAKKALEVGIKTVVFDRSGYQYHGRVKAVCDGARAEKLVI